MWRGSQHAGSRGGAAKKTVAPKRPQTRVQLSKSKVAQQRTQKRVLLGAGALVLGVSFFGAVSWASFHEALQVQTIIVTGNEEIRPRAVQSELMLATASAHMGLFSKQNLLLYPRAALEQKLLDTFPRLETVTIDRHFTAQEVEVVVAERDIWGRWCTSVHELEEVCYHIDETGIVFEPANESSQNMVVVTGGLQETRTDPLRAQIAPYSFETVVQTAALLRDISLEPQRITLKEDDAFIQLADGWELRIALDKDLGAALFNLRAVLDEHGLRNDGSTLEYIDMRFDERVYYKHHDMPAEVADNHE